MWSQCRDSSCLGRLEAWCPIGRSKYRVSTFALSVAEIWFIKLLRLSLNHKLHLGHKWEGSRILRRQYIYKWKSVIIWVRIEIIQHCLMSFMDDPLEQWFSTAGARPGTGTCRPFHWDLKHYRNWKCIRKCIKIKYFLLKKYMKKTASGTILQKTNIYWDK